MSWSYSGNPAASELDMYRFAIGDTLQEDQLMQDEEIKFILDISTSMNTRLYKMYDFIANKFARESVKQSLGPESEDTTERKKYYEQKAKEYKVLSSASNISVPVYSYDKVFRKGMHNNV